MNKKLHLLFLIVLLFIVKTSFGQAIWTAIEEPTAISNTDPSQVYVENFKSYKLNYDRIYHELKNNKKTILLPQLDGKIEDYSLKPMKVMNDIMAADHPELKAYYAYNYNNNTEGVISISPHGLYGLFYGSGTKYSIEVSDYHNPDTYRLFENKDLHIPSNINTCGLDDATIVEENSEKVAQKRADEEQFLHTYTLILSATSVYTNSSPLNGDVSAVLSSFVNLVAGLNLTQGREVGINYVLSDKSEEMIFTDAESDPYDGMVPGEILSRNTSILFNNFGFDGYDIGHVLSARCTGSAAGISRFKIPCNLSKKGGGITCYYGSFTYLYNVTVHEFGHHMGASHSWSNCPGSLAQLSSSTAYEIGSGYTIMSYNGSCGAQNVSKPEADFYHTVNLEEMELFHRSASQETCGEFSTDNGNSKPEVTILAQQGLYIPIETPFILEGSGTDPDGDDLLFNWEQYDLGPTSDIGDPIDNSPAFVGQDPGPESNRLIPELFYVRNHNATSKLEPYIDYSRSIKFRLTARDHKYLENPESPGSFTFEQLQFNTTADAGPFRISSLSKEKEMIPGEELTINWDVANTDLAPVNCKMVDIYFSSDNGETWAYKIGSRIFNDGSHTVTIPDIQTDDGRIIVRASDNIFLNMNGTKLEILEATKPAVSISLDRQFIPVCVPDVVTYTLSTKSINGWDKKLTPSVANLPDGPIVTFDKTEIGADEELQVTLDLTDYPETGETYTSDIILTDEDGNEYTVDFVFETISNDFTTFDLLSPDNGAELTPQVPTLSWTGNEAALNYILTIAKDEEFKNIVETYETADTTLVLDFQLERNTAYFWKVEVNSLCGFQSFDKVNYFVTETQLCSYETASDLPKSISRNGTPTITSKIQINSTGVINDINIVNIDGTHEYMSDLIVTLTSPSGTEVVLLDRVCGTTSGFVLDLDDEAPTEVECPLLTARAYRPDEPLSTFDGENPQGTWTLTISDVSSSYGGELRNWDIELCSDPGAAQNPSAMNNILYVGNGKSHTLQYAIAASHPNINERDLFVQFVKQPVNGEIIVARSGIYTPGELVPYTDIMDYDVYYQHLGINMNNDSLEYIVISPDGGSSGIAKLQIVVDDVKSSTKKTQLDKIEILTFPNPVRQTLNVFIPSASSKGKLSILSIDGRVIKTIPYSGNTNSIIDLSELANGLYLINYKSDTAFGTKRIVKQ